MNGKASKLIPAYQMLTGLTRRRAKRAITGMNRQERTEVYSLLRQKNDELKELEA